MTAIEKWLRGLHLKLRIHLIPSGSFEVGFSEQGDQFQQALEPAHELKIQDQILAWRMKELKVFTFGELST